MRKLEATQWYSYMFNADMANFQDYYEGNKQWFDSHPLDQEYLATNTGCQEKGNNPMYIDDCTSISAWPTTTKKCIQPQANAQSVIQVITESKPDTAMDQRKFLAARVHELKYAKYEEIAEQFHKNEPAGPKTVDELKERLKKGHYTVEKPKCYDDDDEIYWRDAFSWRTPETQFDKVGYKAASKELATFITDILDQIAILDPKEGLALLDDLKKWKPAKAKK